MSVSTLPKGTAFVRYASALALSKGRPDDAAIIAANRWGPNSPPALVAKDAAAGSTAESGVWGSEFGSYRGAAREFWGLVAERSVIGRFRFLRRIPLRVRMIWTTSGVTAAWVAEGNSMPASEMSFAQGTLDPQRIVAMAYATDEMLEAEDAAAETALRDDMVRALVEALDGAFLTPTNDGSADAPAAITNGAPSVPATADPAADLKALIDAFTGDLTAAYLTINPTLAASLSSADRPNIGARGGDLLGIPVLTSRAAPEGQIALIDPTGVAYAEDAVELRTSRQGTIDVATDPAGPATQVSLWQNNCAAIAASRRVTWFAARPSSVAIIEGANYG